MVKQINIRSTSNRNWSIQKVLVSTGYTDCVNVLLPNATDDGNVHRPAFVTAPLPILLWMHLFPTGKVCWSLGTPILALMWSSLSIFALPPLLQDWTWLVPSDPRHPTSHIGVSYVSEAPYEASIMFWQSTKRSYFCIGLGHGKFQNGSYVFIAGANSFLQYMVHEVYYLRLEEGTFGGFQFKIKLGSAPVLSYVFPGVLPPYDCTLSHRPSRWCSRSSSTPPAYFASDAEMSRVHYITQKASLWICRILDCRPWRRCTAVILGPYGPGQNPLLKSIVEKCAAPAILSNTSCILGRG